MAKKDEAFTMGLETHFTLEMKVHFVLTAHLRDQDYSNPPGTGKEAKAQRG